HHDHEQHRQRRGGADPEIRALLGQQLAQLPAVGGEGCGHHRAPVYEPSVRSKKRPSSVAPSGTSAAMPTPAETSARESSKRAASSAVKRISSPSHSTFEIP